MQPERWSERWSERHRQISVVATWLLLAGLLPLVPLAPVRAQEALGVRVPLSAALDSLIRAEMAKQAIPGLSLAVVREGKVLYSAGYGNADREKFVPVTAETQFRLGSISKTFTAAAVLQLVEQGKLDLDAPVQKYVPTYPEKPWKITTRQLLGHLAGIRHYKGSEIFSNVHYTDVLAPLAIFQNDPLAHEPETKYLYSTYGYNLLGAVVQGASGQPFTEYVQKNVFDRVGMPGAAVDDVTRDLPLRATGYVVSNDKSKAVIAPVFDATNKIPGGGYLASALDMARYASAMMYGKVVRPETCRLMWTSQKTRDGKATGYGMGWSVGTWEGKQTAAHGGGQPGVSTILWMVPEEKFAVVLLTNRTGSSLSGIAKQIAGMVLMLSLK
ncbi:MAG: serine hydrolase domain-containing protein [Armatimonadaceae bacterium]